MSDNDDTQEVRTDGTGIVPPDDETPTWSERKARSYITLCVLCASA